MRVFALVRTQATLRGRARPRRPARPGRSWPRPRTEPWHLTSVEQEELPAAPDLEALLAGLSWPSTVDGMAVTVERVVLPPAAEEAMPAGHRRGARVPAGPPRAAGRAARRRRAARRAVLVRGAQPRRTTPPTRSARARTWCPGLRRRRVPDVDARRDRRAASVQVGRSSAVRRRRSPSIASRASCSVAIAHHAQPVRHVADDLVAVRGRGQEPRRAVARRAGELLPDAADRPDLAGHVHGARCRRCPRRSPRPPASSCR